MRKTVKATTVKAASLISFPPLLPVPGHDNPELASDGNLLSLCLPSKVQDKLDNLFAEWDALDQQVKALKAEQAEKAEEMGNLLDTRGLKAISCSDLNVRWVYSHSSSINKLALLKNGVSADVIVASTAQKAFRRLSVSNPARAAEARAEREQEAEEGV